MEEKKSEKELQEAIEKWKMDGMHIKYAETVKVEAFKEYVQKVLDKIKFPRSIVTDRSWLSDFHVEERHGTEEQFCEWVCEQLGIKVSLNEQIWRIAFKLYQKDAEKLIGEK